MTSPRLTLFAVILTFGTGSVDAASFVRLGGVFSSVMTGNLVVAGSAISSESLDTALHTVVALVGYVMGAALGTHVAGRPRPDEPVWPGRVTVTLAIELGVIACFALGWELAGEKPGIVAEHVLLALAALAMGMQSAAMRGLGGRAALSTTYLTGTLTGVVAALLTPREGARFDVPGMAILAALTAGAAAGAAFVSFAPAFLPAIPLTTLTLVVVLALFTGPPGAAAG
ncbi:YoaK family protein [Microtetraspora fusca]|uniref:YoaK family protein n=1 Tax=Microtetraspora fusca TaxID=1997 RepID=UPI000829F9D7|nr:YoaK family protein [Microtetraspora fusca]